MKTFLMLAAALCVLGILLLGCLQLLRRVAAELVQFFKAAWHSPGV